MVRLIGYRGARTNQAPSGCFGCSGCIVPIIGLIFLMIGIYLVRDTLQFLPGTTTAQGTIIHCSYDDTSNDTSNSCNPTIQFTTKSGQSITIRSSISSNSFYEGQQVQVRYHPNTPQDGRMDSFMSTWLMPVVFTGIGLLLLLFSPIILLRGLLNSVGLNFIRSRLSNRPF